MRITNRNSLFFEKTGTVTHVDSVAGGNLTHGVELDHRPEWRGDPTPFSPDELEEVA